MSMRKSLRPLAQVPQAPPTAQVVQISPVVEKPRPSSSGGPHLRSQSVESFNNPLHDGSISPPAKPRPLSMAMSRADSIRMPMREHARHQVPQLEAPDLQRLGKSATGHLRTLSKFVESASEDDFAIKSPEQEVVGLHGRRRLQRTDSMKGQKSATSGWASRNWMDQQRQFLQAYEYLCHIGEAKEWIEDIITKDLPAIVELEEALRDGVTLAEIVEAIKGKPVRIFRHPKLQYRHSNNYAHFFQFLEEVDLPELFRFELIDLYEKKNVPKVIYCIHALSWLLFRKGMVDFRIGNLVGKLQFEDHELEAMQKGLDKAGVSMPNFSGMQANFAVEPEPEPVESEEDRIDRELAESEAIIVDLQAQIRGAMLRIRLGNMMQQLWDNEELVVDLQSRIRGDWARQIAYYRLDMQRFAINLQSAARGFLMRSRIRGEEEYWRDKEVQVQVLKVQNLFRGRAARAQVQHIKSRIQQHENGIREFQAAIRGALQRLKVGNQYEQTRDSEAGVLHVQAMIRGALLRQEMDRQFAGLKENEAAFVDLQAVSRAMRIRQALRADQENLRRHESMVTLLQAAARGALARKQNAETQEMLDSADVDWSDLHAKIRGNSLRMFLQQQQQAFQAEISQIVDLQSTIRGGSMRILLQQQQEALQAELPQIVDLESRIRGNTIRHFLQQQQKAFEAELPSIVGLESMVRGNTIRHFLQQQQKALETELPSIVDLQSVARGGQVRSEVATILAQLEDEDSVITSLQSYIRGYLSRQRHFSDLKALHAETPAIVDLQSAGRGFIQRQRTFDILCELNNQEPEIIQVQGFARGMMLRMEIGILLGQAEEHEEAIVELQALARGMMVRRKFVEKKRFYKENMEKVIKIQSFVRGRQQGEAYKSLTSGTNPPVSTVKNFVHLLNDNDMDFDEEIGTFLALWKCAVTD
jgi:Ras GTPase-activating-like protein IQGAP2/3